MYYLPAVSSFKEPIRKALREMVGFAAVIAVLVAGTSNIFKGGPLLGVLTCVVGGLLFAPFAWAAYQLIRFILGR